MTESQITTAIGGFLIAACAAYLALKAIIYLAKKYQLLDKPNERKMHTNPKPTMGGIAIFTGLVMALALVAPGIFATSSVWLLLGAGILMSTGVYDDLKDLTPKAKLVFQFLAAGLAMANGILLPEQIGPLEIPIWLNYFLTPILIVGFTNAFNLMDGIDGLAGGLVVIASSTLAWFAFSSGNYQDGLLFLILVGACLAFLRLNFYPSKIFMGDSGSLFMGYLIIVFGLKTLNQPGQLVDPIFPVMAITLLPIFDMARLIVIRISQGRSPFSADKNHLHHLLLNTGYNHRWATLWIYAGKGILVSVSFLLASLESPFFLGLTILWITGVAIFEGVRFRKILQLIKAIKNNETEAKGKQTINHLLKQLN